jgi:hypothetical protein
MEKKIDKERMDKWEQAAKKATRELLANLDKEAAEMPTNLEEKKAAIRKHDNLPDDFEITEEWIEKRLIELEGQSSYYIMNGTYRCIPGQPHHFDIPHAKRIYTTFESWLDDVHLSILDFELLPGKNNEQ